MTTGQISNLRGSSTAASMNSGVVNVGTDAPLSAGTIDLAERTHAKWSASEICHDMAILAALIIVALILLPDLLNYANIG